MPEIYIENICGTERIHIYENADGDCYVFLPSYAHMDEVKIGLPKGLEASLGELELEDGMDCSVFAPGREYELMTPDGSWRLTFCQSANVAAMFVDTASGKMDYIHRDSNYEERAVITVYKADGSVDSNYTDAVMKGRGNSTWLYDKKPYALSLSIPGQLLGMAPATNWVLLANATDGTSLHNRLVFDMTNQLWPEAGQENAYVDLYLNGEYNGLYLLTEKVESGENRLDIDTLSGDFLCKIEMAERFGELRHGFTTAHGRTVEICEPRELDDAQQQRIQRLVNQLEQSIVSGEDLRHEPGMDLDSWVRRYITDEISANVDSDKASAYFYYKDGRFYAGPVWDFDLSFGSNLNGDMRYSDPGAFVARPHELLSEPGSSYYRALCENESFINRVGALYEAEYLPWLERVCSGSIAEQADIIAAASGMNALRWDGLFSAGGENSQNISDYLTQRKCFAEQFRQASKRQILRQKQPDFVYEIQDTLLLTVGGVIREKSAHFLP